MKSELQISVLPEEAADVSLLKKIAANKVGITPNLINHLEIKRKSIDARGKEVKFVLRIILVWNEPTFVYTPRKINYTFKHAHPNKRVLIVGAGPSGYFAALKLLEKGLKPVILERGKPVKERRRDLAAITKQHLVNPNSNYCFGEGGAGTYSDGKLYTRSTKRGDVNRILELLVMHGAKEEILIEAHPHIGTNKLPQIITTIRNTIEQHGGEVHFNERVIDFIIKDNKVYSVITENTNTLSHSEFSGEALILAVGHSSRDIFEWFYNHKYQIEAKPFAMGVRIEHPQTLIDQIQYHKKERGPYLPPASYSLVTQAMNKGVYSFCMCPGGIIAPCATAPNEVVTNGWSPSKRDNPFANSGIVVEVKPDDYKQYLSAGALAGLKLQQYFEHTAFVAGGKTQTAPAQRMIDFINNKISNHLPECSYIPGIKSMPLHELMPKSFTRPMQEAFKIFGKSMKGYLTNEAVLVGFETRTSSPVRIPRDKQTLNHPQIINLYPCGEGAGYAGGIVSAAIDGERCAEAVIEKLL